MPQAHFGAARALLASALGMSVILTSCQLAPNPPAVRPTAILTQPPTAAPRFEPMTPSPSPLPPTGLPTPVEALSTPDSSADLATITPEPTEMPTLTPAPLRTAATLPADQPWLKINDAGAQCGPNVSAYHLIAVDRAGALTQLDRDITALAARVSAPPLLVTCDADGAYAIVDPVRWTSLRLHFDPDIVVTQIVLSADNTRAILQLSCRWDSPCMRQPPMALGQIIDLRSGALVPYPALPASHTEGLDSRVNIELIGWGAHGLYYATARNRAGGTSLEVLDPDNPHDGIRVLASNVVTNLTIARELLITTSPDTNLVLSDLRQGTTQTIEETAWISNPSFAPDGSALTYFRAKRDPYSSIQPPAELVLFDIVHNTKTILTDALGLPLEIYAREQGSHATFWSLDSQRIIAITQSPSQQAALLTRNGALINQVPFQSGSILGLTDDDQLVLDLQGNGAIWQPLRPGAAPYMSGAIATSWSVDSVMTPRGHAVPPPAAARPAPATTQLPTPAVPTPLPAVPASIAKLRDLPADAELLSEPRLTDHVLYRVRGTLYSQPLRGGPAAYLGGDDTNWAGPLALASGGKSLIVQLPDGVYRVPLGGGQPRRLTRAPTAGNQNALGFVQVSSDGSRLIYTVTGPPPPVAPDQQIDGSWNVALYSVPTAGGDPVLLSPALAADQGIVSFMITPDNRWAVYMVGTPDANVLMQPGNRIAPSVVAMYSVPLAGGTPRRLAVSPRLKDPIGGWMITDDSQYVLYRTQTTLNSVAVAGGAPVRLSSSDVQQITSFWTSPDYQWVFYNTGAAIYRVAIAGGSAANVTSALTPVDGVWTAALTPDGAQLVVRTSPGLYRIPAVGGPATLLGSLSNIGAAQYDSPLIAGGRVIYQDGDAINSVELAGGTPVRLTQPLEPGASLQIGQLSPDARSVIYTIEQPRDRTRAILSVPIGGGPPVTLLAGNQNDTILYSVSGGYAIGRAGATLYAAPLAGGPTLQLTTMPLAEGMPVLSANGLQIVYIAKRAGASAGNTSGLFVATLTAR